jgi:hypothetical protein
MELAQPRLRKEYTPEALAAANYSRNSSSTHPMFSLIPAFSCQRFSGKKNKKTKAI